jgi:hypothetical protein
MLKKTILIFTIFALLAAGYFCLPKYTAEVCRRKQFVVDRDFVSMRKSLSQGRFEEEILRANNATMIQKSWIDKGFHIERPLRKDRYWEFNGVLQAKVSVNDPRTGQMTVDLQHKVLVTPEQIDLEATVPRNLGKSGFDEITPVLCRYTQRTFNGLTRTGIAAMLLSGKVS